MYELVLVPLDGSQMAEAALPDAQEIASRFQSKVVLFHAITPRDQIVRETLPWGSLNPETEEVPVGLVKQRYEAERNAAETYLTSIMDRLAAEGIAVEAHLEEGRPADAILRYVEGAGVSLVVMSTHGRGGLGRMVFGSVADAVLRKSSTPILLVRALAEKAQPA